MNPIILLTATINARKDGFTKLLDPQKRLDQYLDALNFYLNNTDNKIIFVENSNIDISDKIGNNNLTDRLEILTFDGNKHEKCLGKGIGEMNIIEYALVHSKFIQQNRNSIIFKITGRLILLNIANHLNLLKSKLLLDNMVIGDLRHNLSSADSRFFGGTIRFYKEFIFKYKSLINDSNGFYFEHALAKSILSAIINDFSYEPLSYYLDFNGQSGSSGIMYNDNFIRTYVRNIKMKIKSHFLK